MQNKTKTKPKHRRRRHVLVVLNFHERALILRLFLLFIGLNFPRYCFLALRFTSLHHVRINFRLYFLLIFSRLFFLPSDSISHHCFTAIGFIYRHFSLPWRQVQFQAISSSNLIFRPFFLAIKLNFPPFLSRNQTNFPPFLFLSGRRLIVAYLCPQT